MRGLGVTFLVRRARSSWLLLACVAVTVLLATGLAAVLWTFTDAVIPSGAQGILAAPQSRVIGLSGVANVRAGGRRLAADPGHAAPGLAGGRLPDRKRAVGGPDPAADAGYHPDTTAGRDLVPVRDQRSGDADCRRHGQVRRAPAARCPRRLPAAVASRLHLTLGSVLTGTPSRRAQSRSRCASPACTGPGTRRRRTGRSTWCPSRGSASSASPSSTRAQHRRYRCRTYGPAVVNPAAFAGGLAASQASWSVLPPGAGLSRGNIEGLAAGTSAAVSRLSAPLPDGLTVTSGLPPLLAGVASTVVLARSLFTIAALQLLLVAGAGAGAGRPAAGQPARGGVRAAAGARRHQVAGGAAGAGRGGGARRRGRPGGRAGRHPPDRRRWPAWPTCALTAHRATASPRWPGCRPSPCWCCARP